MEHFMVDHDFIDALGLELIEGRAFSLEFATDTLGFKPYTPQFGYNSNHPFLTES